MLYFLACGNRIHHYRLKAEEYNGQNIRHISELFQIEWNIRIPHLKNSNINLNSYQPF